MLVVSCVNIGCIKYCEVVVSADLGQFLPSFVLSHVVVPSCVVCTEVSEYNAVVEIL